MLHAGPGGCGVRLTVVGCSGSGPGPRLAGVLLPGRARRLPAGRSTWAAASFGTLQGLLDPADVDAVFLIAPARRPLPRRRAVRGLAPLLRPVQRPAVPLYAPVGADRRLAMAYDGDGRPAHRRLRLRAHRPGHVRRSGRSQVRTARTAHPVECHAMRLTRAAGRWSTPATPGPAERIVELARGADVLLAEAAHPETQGLPAGPAPDRPAGRRARAAAGVGRLLLTHVPAWVDRDGQLSQPAPCSRAELVQPGATYDI